MTAGKIHHFYRPPEEYYSTDALLEWVRARPLKNSSLNVPVCIWGPRGIGKTSQVKSFCAKRNLQIVTYHPAHDVSGKDLLGQQIIGEDGKVRYALPDFLPHGKEAGDGVWFIDEINRANEEVLAGLMEPLVEGTISQSGWQIPDGWQIVVAANPFEKGYKVQELDAAMVSRMLHYNPGWDASLWANWAKKQGVNENIINFTLKNTDMLEIGASKVAYQIPAEVSQKIEANPRSIEYLDALYEPGMPEELLRVIGYGLIGRNATEALIRELRQETDVILPHEILTPAETDVYPYDRTLMVWRHDQESYPRMVNGSVQLLAAELINRPTPMSDNPAESVDAQNVGRFIASLMPLQQRDALATIMRSCTAWHPAVKNATEIWKRSMAGATVQ